MKYDLGPDDRIRSVDRFLESVLVSKIVMYEKVCKLTSSKKIVYCIAFVAVVDLS